MENVRKASIDQAAVVDTWLTRWSQFIQQSPLSKTGFTETRSEMIQQVLEAMLRGESCISVAAEAFTVLDDLVMDEQQAQQQKAPFVYDQQQLYLYRYWALEQSLAQQVARLKLQNLTQVDISAYAHLLEDHTKNRLWRWWPSRRSRSLQVVQAQGKPIPWRVLLRCSNKVCLIFVLRWLHRQVRQRSG